MTMELLGACKEILEHLGDCKVTIEHLGDCEVLRQAGRVGTRQLGVARHSPASTAPPGSKTRYNLGLAKKSQFWMLAESSVGIYLASFSTTFLLST